MSSPNNFLPEATDNGGTHLAPVMQELLQRFDKLTFQDDVQQLQTVKEEEDETSNEQLRMSNIAAKNEGALANVKAQQKDLVDFFEWINPSEGWTTISSGNLSTGIAATPTTTLSSDYCSSVYVSSIDGDYFGDTTSSIWEFDLCRSRSAPARLFMYDGQIEVSSQSEVQSLEALGISSCGESLQADDDDAEYFDLLEVYNTIPSVKSVMKTKKSSPRVKSECNGLAVLNFISDSYFDEDSSKDSEWLYDPWTTSPTYMMDWNEGAMADLSYFTSGYVDAQSMISKRSGSTASSISMESKDAILKAIRGKFTPPFNVVQKQVRDLAFKANNMKDFLGLIPEHYLDSVFFDYKMLVSEKMMN